MAFSAVSQIYSKASFLLALGPPSTMKSMIAKWPRAVFVVIVACIQVLSLLLTSCVILGKLFSVLSSFISKMGMRIILLALGFYEY